MGTNLFDQYTLLHFCTGVIAYFFGINFTTWNIGHAVFEFAENTEIGMNFINEYFPWWPGGKPYPDKFRNTVGDMIGALLGWIVARYLDKYGAEKGWYQAHL